MGLPDRARLYVQAGAALVAIGPRVAMISTSTAAFGHRSDAFAFGRAVALIVAASGHLGGAHIIPQSASASDPCVRPERATSYRTSSRNAAGLPQRSAAFVRLLGPAGLVGATVLSVSLGRGRRL